MEKEISELESSPLVQFNRKNLQYNLMQVTNIKNTLELVWSNNQTALGFLDNIVFG